MRIRGIAFSLLWFCDFSILSISSMFITIAQKIRMAVCFNYALKFPNRQPFKDFDAHQVQSTIRRRFIFASDKHLSILARLAPTGPFGRRIVRCSSKICVTLCAIMRSFQYGKMQMMLHNLFYSRGFFRNWEQNFMIFIGHFY